MLHSWSSVAYSYKGILFISKKNWKSRCMLQYKWNLKELWKKWKSPDTQRNNFDDLKKKKLGGGSHVALPGYVTKDDSCLSLLNAGFQVHTVTSTFMQHWGPNPGILNKWAMFPATAIWDYLEADPKHLIACLQTLQQIGLKSRILEKQPQKTSSFKKINVIHYYDYLFMIASFFIFS